MISGWYARLWRAVFITAIAAVLLGVATRLDPLRQGLRAEYLHQLHVDATGGQARIRPPSRRA